jgi:hypothetical protein
MGLGGEVNVSPPKAKTREISLAGFLSMVGVRGFEPPASRTRTVHSTKLSYTPMTAIL